MATIKSYTDISQSKKLVEILPLESADMFYLRIIGETYDKYGELIPLEENLCKIEIDSLNRLNYPEEDVLPCWSLAALLEVLPEYNLQKTDWGNKTEYKIVVTINEENYASKNYDNPLDACYEMIIKLHELNLL